jgi:hypothetical protein
VGESWSVIRITSVCEGFGKATRCQEKLSASVENAAQNVVSGCDRPEADDRAEER